MKKIIYLLSLLYCNSVVFAQSEYEIADKELNETYQKVMKTFNEKEKIEFRNRQRAWIKERDKKCLSLPKDCLIEFTNQRIVFIQEFNSTSNNHCSEETLSFKNKDDSNLKLYSYYCDKENSEILTNTKVYRDDVLIFDLEDIEIKDVNSWRFASFEDINSDGFGDLILYSIPYTKTADSAIFLFDFSVNNYLPPIVNNGYGHEVVDDYLLNFNQEYTSAVLVKKSDKIKPKEIYAKLTIDEVGNVRCSINIEKTYVNIITNKLENKLCQGNERK